MSLAKLRMEYSYFKMMDMYGVISDDFLSLWPILEALIITPKEGLQKSSKKNVC